MPSPSKLSKDGHQKDTPVKKAEAPKHISPARSPAMSPSAHSTFTSPVHGSKGITPAPSESMLLSIKRNEGNPSASTSKDDFLASFGIKPAASSNTAKALKAKNRDSTLKCCLLSAGLDSAILFRLQPNDPTNNNWSEKCFFDALRRRDNWITDLAFDSSCLFWYENNVVQKNPKGYYIRMFAIRTEKNPSNEQLLNLGHHLCTKINELPGNTTKTEIDETSYFWIPREEAVWAGIIGIDEALVQLTKSKGHVYAGYFEIHKAAIDTYFHSGTYSLALAQRVTATASLM